MTVWHLVATMRANQLTIQETAEGSDLPVEAVEESLNYYMKNKSEIEAENEEVGRRLGLYANQHDHVLMTFNPDDFRDLHEEWHNNHRRHSGKRALTVNHRVRCLGSGEALKNGFRLVTMLPMVHFTKICHTIREG